MTQDASTTYFLALSDPEEILELSRDEIMAKLSRGEITNEFWVYIEGAPDWRQIADIPELQPEAIEAEEQNKAQSIPEVTEPVAPLAASPAPATSVPTAPVVPMAPVSTATTFPALNLPGVAAPAPAQKEVKTKKEKPKKEKAKNHTVKERGGFPVFSFFFLLLFLALVAVIGLNYYLVDKPFDESFAKTPFSAVVAHAHLAAFAEPDDLVIHVLPNAEIRAANFDRLLVDLSASTPPRPTDQKPFTTVALTPLWLGQYAFTGDDWRHLAGMTNASADDRKTFIVDHVADMGGSPLIGDMKRITPQRLKTQEEDIWQQMVSSFAGK